MSAAPQLPMVWDASNAQRIVPTNGSEVERKSATQPEVKAPLKAPETCPVVSVALYRRHTEKMLGRYLYASMEVGRAPAILDEPIAGGGSPSSRPVRTFEDAVIFVLDFENCRNQLGSLDRQMLRRVVIQEYTQTETAILLGMSVRAVSYKFPQAFDRLTEKLLVAGLLVLPH